MEENENYAKRIGDIMEYYELNKNSLSVKIGLENNTTITKIINNGANPSRNILYRILKTYPDVNPEWLLLGEGEMLKKKQRKSKMYNADNMDGNTEEGNEAQEPTTSDNYTGKNETALINIRVDITGNLNQEIKHILQDIRKILQKYSRDD